MDSNALFILVDANRAREQAQRLFETVSKMLTEVLPPTADVRHIGAVPGRLTKGDLDIVIRIPTDTNAEVRHKTVAALARFIGRDVCRWVPGAADPLRLDEVVLQ
jgi:GrpB-like predicted nucleotidyltransferase (UPF0157 family)